MNAQHLGIVVEFLANVPQSEHDSTSRSFSSLVQNFQTDDLALWRYAANMLGDRLSRLNCDSVPLPTRIGFEDALVYVERSWIKIF
jgi:hypothetical protein